MRYLGLLLVLIAMPAFALTGGFTPAYEVDGEITCVPDGYVPLWELVTPPDWIEPPPVPEPPTEPPEPTEYRPSASNYFKDCKDCHPSKDWDLGDWEKHGDHKEELKCIECHDTSRR